MKDYQRVIAVSKYARWLEDQNRRETWEETVNRYCDNVLKNPVIKKEVKEEIRQAIFSLSVMPSMRAMMTAGPALDRCNVAGYNCSYLPIDSLRSFDEMFYVTLCGTGVGFSVERKNIDRLPQVSEHFEKTNTKIVVGDSKAGWARALKELLALLWSGQIPDIDYSNVRPAGAPLKTFGGRASGPEPLKETFDYVTKIVTSAAGRKLRAIECHDIVCKIADCVVVGGVRRAALISLSDLSDKEMALAKSGNWWQTHPHRSLANNSAVYEEKPSLSQFMDEWKAIYDSKSGERGIINRAALKLQAAKTGRRKVDGVSWGVNPCAEIILRPYQFCNLSEVVVRENDTLEILKKKVELATIIGTVQSTFTNFKYLRKIWKDNCEEERLLGVSLTGVFDEIKVFDMMAELKQHAIEVNEKWAKKLGINQSVSITTQKPSGTVSELVDAAPGVHTRFYKHYIRTIRSNNVEAFTQFLKDQGVPWEADVMKPNDRVVFSFPQKAPNNAITSRDITAIQHLEYWMRSHKEWCEHNPSVTVKVGEDEWLEVASYVYTHFDDVAGISFLPKDDSVYQQAPYQEITEEQYNTWVENFPKINWDDLPKYERGDQTKSAAEFACVSGDCTVTEI